MTDWTQVHRGVRKNWCYILLKGYNSGILYFLKYVSVDIKNQTEGKDMNGQNKIASQ